jgi:hypothetical protein
MWDYFIIFMITYFLISIVNSLVAQYVEDMEKPKIKSPKKHKKE